MTIVHGVLSLEVGGLERIVVALARGQAEQDHAVTVLCLETQGTLARELEAAGVTVIALNKPPGRPVEFANTVNTALKSLSPQVLHTHQIGVAFHLAAIAKSLGVRVIHTEHGNPFVRAAGLVAAAKMRLLMRTAVRNIDRFCCVSDEIAATVRRWQTVSAAKVQVVPNGIAPPPNVPNDFRSKLGIPADANVVGTVGRLHEVKQQQVLLQAVAKLPGVWALLVGDGPERDSLTKLAADLGIMSRTVFAGYQTEPWGALQAMDVFALTSRSEGFPVSLLEAWALSKPAVCSAVGGLTTIIENNVNGVLISAGDINGFASAFESLLNDHDHADEIAAGGLSTFEKQYTLNAMLNRYQFLYSRM